MLQEEQATVRLFRFDPEVDTEPRYDVFKVPYQGRSVLNVLLYIYQNLDSTFAFRWGCEKHYCRCCVVSVNKQPVLACMAPAEKNMRIDPHPKFKVIKDLLVDLSRPKGMDV
jgi:succinate dehydrogenase/fumarate reductase-like Fe-S protein